MKLKSNKNETHFRYKLVGSEKHVGKVTWRTTIIQSWIQFQKRYRFSQPLKWLIVERAGARDFWNGYGNRSERFLVSIWKSSQRKVRRCCSPRIMSRWQLMALYDGILNKGVTVTHSSVYFITIVRARCLLRNFIIQRHEVRQLMNNNFCFRFGIEKTDNFRRYLA